MTDMVKRLKLRRAYGRIQEILDQEGVYFKTFDAVPGTYLTVNGGGPSISMKELSLLQPYDRTRPPMDWDAFLAEAVDILVAKNRDFKSAFVKILLNVDFDPVTIWKWEVKKKLDRIRTWAETGSLAVKGEGVKDSVLDLFGYTVLYFIYKEYHQLNLDPLPQLHERTFYSMAARYSAREWLLYLTNVGLIDRSEYELVSIIFKYMGVSSE